MSNHTTPIVFPEGLYHPIEHAILADYFQVDRPACASDINLDDEVEHEWDEENHDGIIRIRPGLGGGCTINTNAGVDPIWLLLITILGIGYLRSRVANNNPNKKNAD